MKLSAKGDFKAQSNRSGSAASFTVKEENGTTLRLTVSFDENGVLVVTVPGLGELIGMKEAVLMGIEVALQEMKVELSTFTSILLEV